MKAYGGVGVYIYIFLTSAEAGSDRSAPRPGRFNPEAHWIGCWVDTRAGLDDVEKRKLLTLPGLEIRPLGLYTDCAIPAPLRSQERSAIFPQHFF
jgi:hypothetical protein